MTTSAIALGSNLGDRAAELRAAVGGLASVARLVAVSPVYETAPVGGPSQGPYLNAVVLLETARAPEAFMRELLMIERSRGRSRRVRWGPRTLDLDLLLWGRAAIDRPGLTVPHPRMLSRRFVLEPLLAVLPDARMPDGTAVAAALAEVSVQDLAPTGITIV